MPTLFLHAIEHLAAGALRGAGVAKDAAASVARSIRRAEADGIRLVGLGYLPTYLVHVRGGRVLGYAVPMVRQDKVPTVSVDAGDGFAHAGEPIPEGWALDAAGQPTTDPVEALRGSMAPFGGVKGASVALMVELLSAGLTGASFSKDARAYAVADAPPPGIGRFVVAFDPDAFDPGFFQRIELLFAVMLEQDGVRLPSDKRLAARARADKDGVDVDKATLAACQS